MKTFKTTQLAVLILSLLYFSCTNNNLGGGQSTLADTGGDKKCPESKDIRSIYNEYIFRIDPCGKAKWPGKIKHLMDSLKNSLKVWKIDTCECDPNVILWKSDTTNPHPEERVGTINDKMKTEGDFLGSVTYNMALDLPDAPPPIKDLKQYRMESDTIQNKMVIAVIDGGINLEEYSNLENYMWSNPDTLECGNKHGLNLTQDSDIINYHGSFVSTIIVNELPSADIKLMDLRIFDKKGNGTLFQASCAMAFAIHHNADLINMSWGYYLDPKFKKPSYLSLVKEAKIKDIIMVCSSGNDSINTDKCTHFLSGLDHKKYSKDASNVVGVSYLNENGSLLHENSNYGKKSVSIAARGVYIFDPDTIQGSSYAAPQVTRALAILKGNNPDLDHHELIDCLLENNTIDLALPLISKGKLKQLTPPYSCETP